MNAVVVPSHIIANIRSGLLTSKTGFEQGGLLLGYRKGGALEIVSLTRPSAWDRASPFMFERSARSHRIRALREWARSWGRVDWIGEWHTHPGGSANPSLIDRKTWVRLARHTGKPMVFIIVAENGSYVGLQSPLRAGVEQLKAIERSRDADLYG